MKQSLPKGKIVNGVLHVTRGDGSKVVFSTIGSRKREKEIRDKKLPRYYNKYAC